MLIQIKDIKILQSGIISDFFFSIRENNLLLVIDNLLKKIDTYLVEGTVICSFEENYDPTEFEVFPEYPGNFPFKGVRFSRHIINEYPYEAAFITYEVLRDMILSYCREIVAQHPQYQNAIKILLSNSKIEL